MTTEWAYIELIDKEGTSYYVTSYHNNGRQMHITLEKSNEKNKKHYFGYKR